MRNKVVDMGKLSNQDLELLKEYVDHLDAMSKDVETELDVKEELEWLNLHGFVKENKKGNFSKTTKGKTLLKVINSLPAKKMGDIA